MRSIYRSAERVLIWIGEATYDTDEVIDHLKRLEKDNESYWTSSWDAIEDDLTGDRRNLLGEGLESLLRRDWFKRVWIIQEAANAEVAEMVWGSRSISSSIFSCAPSLLDVIPEPHCQVILDIMPGPLRNRSWWSTEQRDLSTMLIKFQGSMAADERDKVYALLGIASDTSETGFLKADYNKDVEDVIFEAVSFILNFRQLSSPTSRFFSWTIPKFQKNLNSLANEVLKSAIKTANKPVVRLLTTRDDVDVNIKARHWTPLSWAAEYGYEDLAKQLLADSRVEPNLRDKSGKTPLSRAAAGGKKQVLQLLLASSHVDPNVDDLCRQTPLCHSAIFGQVEAAKLLLTNNLVNSNLIDNYGKTPLFYAAERGHEAVVRLLLEDERTDPDFAILCGSWRTSSQAAEMWRHEAVVKVLLASNRVDPNSHGLGVYYYKPLHRASANGDEAIVRLLLADNRINVNESDQTGETPLAIAVDWGKEVVVRLLLADSSISADLVNAKGRTPLMIAARHSNAPMIQLLLACKKFEPQYQE